MKLYKIKHAETGLYSKGGSSVDDRIDTWRKKPIHWSKRGKTWTGIAALKIHLRQYCRNWTYMGINVPPDKSWKNNIPETWIVQEISIDGTPVVEYSAKSLYPLTDNTL